jgi:hypothetical protein
MKTLKNIHPKTHRLLLLLLLAIVCSLSPSYAQKKNKIDYLALRKLPAGLVLQEKTPYSYEVITDYYNHDILGNFINKMQVKGTYTRGLKENKIRWNNATISQMSASDKDFPAGVKQDYMENFTYNPSDNLINSDVFKNFPVATGVFAKNLVWDVLSFEVFAWTYYDSLQLNIPYTAHKINGKIELGDLGTFENKDIKITWTGISVMNEKTCAVIEFLAMDNPIDFKTDFIQMKGRSHYWGTLWLSLSDMQIEYGVLHEDVNMDMKMAGQEKSQLMNTTRKIEFNKILN